MILDYGKKKAMNHKPKKDLKEFENISSPYFINIKTADCCELEEKA